MRLSFVAKASDGFYHLNSFTSLDESLLGTLEEFFEYELDSFERSFGHGPFVEIEFSAPTSSYHRYEMMEA